MLGPEVQGEWTIYVNAFAFGTIALGFGLQPAITHYIAAGKLNKKTLLSQLFLFVLGVSLLFGFIVLIINSLDIGEIFLPKFGNVQYVLLGLFFHFMLFILNQLFSAVLLAEKQFALTARISGFSAFVLLLIYSVLYYFIAATQFEYFHYFIIFNLLVLLGQAWVNVYSVLKQNGYSLSFKWLDKKLFSLLLSFALLAYATNFVQFLSYKMDIWFINAFEDKQAKLGIYAVAVSLGQLIWLVPSAFHSIIFTQISERTSGEQKKQIVGWAKKIFLFAIVCAIIGYVLAYNFITVFFGIKYQYVIEIFPYLLPGIVIFSPSILLCAYVAGVNRIDINLKASLIGFGIALVGGFLVIPTYSVIGAAAVSTIAYASTTIYVYFQFNKLG